MEQLQFGHLPSAQPSLRVLRETPATRVTQSGAKNVALVELLGAVIGDADTALRVLATYPTIDDLCRAPVADLGIIKGLGPNRVAALQAAIELGRRAHLGSGAERRQIRAPSDAADLLLGEMGVLEQEELRVMSLDTRNRILSYRHDLSRQRQLVHRAEWRNLSRSDPAQCPGGDCFPQSPVG